MLDDYLSDYRKHRYGLADEPKKQPKRIFTNKKLAVKVIMDWRTIAAHKFRTRLGCKQYDITLTKEKSVLMIIKIDLKEKICKHNILSWIIWLIYSFMTLNLQMKLIKVDIITEILTMK